MITVISLPSQSKVMRSAPQSVSPFTLYTRLLPGMCVAPT